MAATPATEKSVKLHNPFVPKAYDLKVTVDLDTWSYTAVEEVTLQRAADHGVFTGDAASVVQLHAAPSMQVSVKAGATLLTRDPDAHTLHLKLDNPGDAEPKILFHFTHTINTELRGFYRVTFQHGGQDHRMASTHFEPTSARLFYICQDEPACRADYTLTVTLPAAHAHYTVLSNGPLKAKTAIPDTDQVAFQFETIPKCPPYLTACIVGELEHVSGQAGDTPISVYCSPGKSDRARFALDVTCFAIEYFTKFFQCKFPLPKLDVVAVPDFPIGGMENWGVITCVESILVDERTASVDSRKRASELLCHEVSHNWFGNLVAISWWEGLWLKEGFASWCGNYASHVRFPDWRCLEDAAGSVSAAMETDSYEYSHPVEVPIRDPADITQIFDSISYNKGMGLVFMLEAFLGDKWSAAVAHYINKYAYSDTKTEQLWEALEESSGLPVKEAMTTFTSQMGYPMVHVERTGTDTVTVRQEPCNFAPTRAAAASGDRASCSAVWCVPLVLSGLSGARTTAALRDRDPLTITLPASLAAETWLTANPHRSGFYRCRYDDATFQAWLDAYPTLSSADRCALIGDTLAAIRMGYDDVDRLVRVAEAVRATEEDMSVLREFAKSIGALAGAMEEAGVAAGITKGQFAFFIAKATALLARPDVGGVGGRSAEEELQRSFTLSSALAQALRENSAETPIVSAHQPLIDWALGEARAFLDDKPCSYATLRECLATYARLDASQPVAEKNAALFAKFEANDGNDEVCRALLYGMCQSPDTAFVKSLASRCAAGDRVRPHFGGNVFMGMSMNKSFQKNEVWDYFKENFEAVDRQWGGGQFRIQVIVEMVGNTLSGEEAARDFEAFFASHPLPNARLAIGRSAEGIRLRDWLSKKWSASAVVRKLF